MKVRLEDKQGPRELLMAQEGRSEVTSGDIATLHTTFNMMIGSYVWFVRTGPDAILRLEFGNPHLEIRKPLNARLDRRPSVIDSVERRIVTPTGQWHLFVENGFWEIRTRRYSCSRAQSNAAAISQLDGQQLMDVKISEQYCLRFVFDLGGVLCVRPPEEHAADCDWSDQDQWVLFSQNGNFLSLSNNNHVKCGTRRIRNR